MSLRSFCRASIFILVVAVGCSDSEPATELSRALQVALEASNDASKGAGAIVLLEAFIEMNATDAAVPEALKQLAILRQQQGDMTAALVDYQRILDGYPASAVADEAQFMIAFVREEHLRDFDGARLAYQLVLDKYPDSELVEQARLLLEHVGEPPDEWVPGFQEGSAEDPQ